MCVIALVIAPLLATPTKCKDGSDECKGAERVKDRDNKFKSVFEKMTEKDDKKSSRADYSSLQERPKMPKMPAMPPN
jgi:hypothetical protein